MPIPMRPNLFVFCVCALTAFPFVAAAQQVDSLQQDNISTPQRTSPLPNIPRKDSTRKDSTQPITSTRSTKIEQAGHSAGYVSRGRRRMQGYRIQVYTGGNTRQAKQSALRMKERVQRLFPELSVYITFKSPRWICRVGDFISREEAKPYLKELRKQGISPEANIISSTVSRSY